jgi:hypothetical protein
MQGYYLIGTNFTYYTNASKNMEIRGPPVKYKTGIYDKGLKTLELNAIKSLFQPHQITIMEDQKVFLGHNELNPPHKW